GGQPPAAPTPTLPRERGREIPRMGIEISRTGREILGCRLCVDNGVINRTGGRGNREAAELAGRPLGRDPGGGPGRDRGVAAAAPSTGPVGRGPPRPGDGAGPNGQPDTERPAVLPARVWWGRGHGWGAERLRNHRARRPLPAGQGRRAVRAVWWGDPTAGHAATSRALLAGGDDDGAAGVLRDDRERARIR